MFVENAVDQEFLKDSVIVIKINLTVIRFAVEKL
jgi:hypothetical protein